MNAKGGKGAADADAEIKMGQESTMDLTPTAMEVLQLESKEKNKDERRIPIGPVIFDLLLSCFVAFVILYIASHHIPIPRRGFVCNDFSIRYNRTELATASHLACGVFSALITVTPICLVEIIRIVLRNGLDLHSFTIRPRDVVIFLLRFCKYAGSSMIGVLLNVAVSRVTKYSVGRLRPHFVSQCAPKPEGDWDHCRNDPLNFALVMDYRCTLPISDEIEARLSFYSTRASYMMHTAVFTAMYLYARLPERIYCYTLRPIFQASVIFGACFFSFSLVREREHFISDILVGFLAGIITAVYSAVHIARMFRQTHSHEVQSSIPQGEDGEPNPLATDLNPLAYAKPGEPPVVGKTAHSPDASTQPSTQQISSPTPHQYAPYQMSTGDPSMATDVDSVLQSTK